MKKISPQFIGIIYRACGAYRAKYFSWNFILLYKSNDLKIII
jgi:hypothetical protein